MGIGAKLSAIYRRDRHISRLILMMVVWAAFMAITRFDKFYTLINFQTMASQFPEFGLMSLGIMVCMITGGIDFSDWKLVLNEAVINTQGTVVTPEVAINYGNLISVILDFIIIAFAIFCVIKAINRLHKKPEEVPVEEPAPPEPSAEEKLLTEIRDLLKERS